MYFIYGEELFLIEKEIKKILKANEGAKPMFFDAESSIYDVLNEINTFSIFEDKKIIILKNFNLLTKSNSAYDQELINSIINKNENCILIFAFSDIKPKSPSTLFKYLLDNAKVIEVKKYSNAKLGGIIQKIVQSKGGTILNINAILLSVKLPNDLNLIISEIDKLLLENKEITKDMIKNSIAKYHSNNIFEFINSFQESDASGLFRAYKEKIDNGESIVNLISQLSNALILCSNIYSYKASNMRIEEIADKLKIHIFRVKKANELLNTMGIEKIKKIIQMLSDLDSNIKTGKIDEVIGFEKLLLEIIR
ncbi:MAG: DNA polymerase III subunit delta [Metamycoplasmataceae bacterium]